MPVLLFSGLEPYWQAPSVVGWRQREMLYKSFFPPDYQVGQMLSSFPFNASGEPGLQHVQHHWGSTFQYPLIINGPLKGGGKHTDLVGAEGTLYKLVFPSGYQVGHTLSYTAPLRFHLLLSFDNRCTFQRWWQRYRAHWSRRDQQPQFLVLPSKWVKCQYESHWKLRQFIQNDEGNPLRAELPALGQEALHPLQGCQAGQIAWGFHQSQGWSTWWCGWRNCWDRQWIHRILSIEVKNWIFKILASSITSFWS